MVFVNSKKFACESCIKGHRSSSCHHTDRPLFEIKKKGRPVSQCEKCRELRQSKKFHSKCTCNPTDTIPKPAPLVSSSGTKSRFVPIAPALPNGIKDIYTLISSTRLAPADARQRVESLLNPCNCKDVWRCKCLSKSAPEKTPGLATLALAASMCCAGSSGSTDMASAEISVTARGKRPTSRPSSPNTSSRSSKRRRGTSSPKKGPDLAPILYTEESSASQSTNVPIFPTMPPLSAIKSIAGSGCTCGVQCACPGCVEHRGASNASTYRKDCTDGVCSSCVDSNLGVALPGFEPSETSTSNSVLDKFFARAAALPAPPKNRRMGVGVGFDPMNIMVYPTTASIPSHGVAFGLVNIPKLECCGGKCECPDGQCQCGRTCDGSCAQHDHSTPPALLAPPATPKKSCCAGK